MLSILCRASSYFSSESLSLFYSQNIEKARKPALDAPSLLYVGYQRSVTFLSLFQLSFKPSNIRRLNLFTKVADRKVNRESQAPSQKSLVSRPMVAQWMPQPNNGAVSPQIRLCCADGYPGNSSPDYHSRMDATQFKISDKYLKKKILGNQAERQCVPESHHSRGTMGSSQLSCTVRPCPKYINK